MLCKNSNYEGEKELTPIRLSAQLENQAQAVNDACSQHAAAQAFRTVQQQTNVSSDGSRATLKMLLRKCSIAVLPSEAIATALGN